MIFMLIQIRFDININNDELLKIIWEHKRKKSWMSWVCNDAEPKLINQMKWNSMEKTWPQAFHVYGWNQFWWMNISPLIGWIPNMHNVQMQWQWTFYEHEMTQLIVEFFI